jgi:hypothetical protein
MVRSCRGSIPDTLKIHEILFSYLRNENLACDDVNGDEGEQGAPAVAAAKAAAAAVILVLLIDVRDDVTTAPGLARGLGELGFNRGDKGLGNENFRLGLSSPEFKSPYFTSFPPLRRSSKL